MEQAQSSASSQLIRQLLQVWIAICLCAFSLACHSHRPTPHYVPKRGFSVIDSTGKVVLSREDIDAVQPAVIYGEKVLWFKIKEEAVDRYFRLEEGQNLTVMMGQRVIYTFAVSHNPGAVVWPFKIPYRVFPDGRTLRSLILEEKTDQAQTKVPLPARAEH